MGKWIADLLGCLSCPSLDDLQTEKAMKIKHQHLPSKVYKYRAVSENSIYNLLTDSVWLSSPSEYNDPYDCSASLSLDKRMTTWSKCNFLHAINSSGLVSLLSAEEIAYAETTEDPLIAIARIVLTKDSNYTDLMCEEALNALRKVISLQSSDLASHFNSILQCGMKVSSFCTNARSIVMWSHYADNHKGFCVEYDLSVLPSDDLRLRILFPVIYSDVLFDFSPSISEDKPNPLYGSLAAIHKSKAWEYEEEWRLVMPIGDLLDNYNFRMPPPSALYMGTRMTKENELQLRDIAKFKGIPVYKMKLAHDEFKLLAEEHAVSGST